MSDCVRTSHCRLCDGPIPCVLSLEPTPPANEFVREADLGRVQSSYPLDVCQCVNCGHVQLSDVVSPDKLFRNYVYVSGTSPSFVDHFRRYAETMITAHGLVPGDLVVEIGSNDGTLLRFFKDAGMSVVGIDPARDIAAKATADGIPTIPSFLSPEIADDLAGQAKLVIANNVMAHIADLRSVVRCIRRMSRPDATFVFEVSYLYDVLLNTLFDTIYHEHLSYHHIDPLVPFFNSEGMFVYDVERVSTHGGSIRVHVSMLDLPRSERMEILRSDEQALGLHCPDFYPESTPAYSWDSLKTKILDIGEELRSIITVARMSGKPVIGYGAPAKATTLMYQLGLDRDHFDFIVDDNPLKIGLYSPGTFVPIMQSSAIDRAKPGLIVILAWNFASQIADKLSWYGRVGGKIIVPLPSVEEI